MQKYKTKADIFIFYILIEYGFVNICETYTYTNSFKFNCKHLLQEHYQTYDIVCILVL